jgi:MFS family permease
MQINRWLILSLASFAHCLCLGVFYMCLPVLFNTIHLDTGMSLEELNFGWAIIPLSSAVSSILGGYLSDRYGTRLVTSFSILLCSFSLFHRAFVFDVQSLILNSLIFGFSSAIVYVNLPKIVDQYFSNQYQSLAQGILFAAYGIGVVIGATLSFPIANLLNGWRNLFFLFSFVSIVLSIVWWLYAKDIRFPEKKIHQEKINIKYSNSELHNILLLSLCYFLFTGGYLGFTGVFPFLMEKWGWTSSDAQFFQGLSMVLFIIGCSIIPSIPDFFKLKKETVFYISFLIAGISLSIAWIASINHQRTLLTLFLALSGFSMGAIGIYFAILFDPKITRPSESGTILGIVTTGSYIGGFVFPLIGMQIINYNVFLGGVTFGIVGLVLAGISILFLKKLDFIIKTE